MSLRTIVTALAGFFVGVLGTNASQAQDAGGNNPPDHEAYSQALQANTQEAWENFINNFPDSPFSHDAAGHLSGFVGENAARSFSRDARSNAGMSTSGY